MQMLEAIIQMQTKDIMNIYPCSFFSIHLTSGPALLQVPILVPCKLNHHQDL